MLDFNSRRPQRVALLLVIILGVIWAVGLTQPSPGQARGVYLPQGSTRLTAQAVDTGFNITGQVSGANVPYVYVSMLRRLYVGDTTRTAVVESRQVNVADGAFSAAFEKFKTGDWLNKIARELKIKDAATLRTDPVLELAVSGSPFKTAVNRDLIVASTFVGYQD